MTISQWLALLSITSGIATSEELADFSGYSLSTCSNLLRMLEIRGYIRKVSAKSGVFVVTPEGKERVRNLLTFIPVER